MLLQAHLHEERRLRPDTFLCPLQHTAHTALWWLTLSPLATPSVTVSFSHGGPLAAPADTCSLASTLFLLCLLSPPVTWFARVHTAQPNTTWFRAPLDPALYTGPASRHLGPYCVPSWIPPSPTLSSFICPSPSLTLGTLSHLRGPSWNLVDEVTSLSLGAICFSHHPLPS